MNTSREQQLFELALEKPAGERPAFLDAGCGDDVTLRKRLEALLEAHEQQSGFLPFSGTSEEMPTAIDTATPTMFDESAGAGRAEAALTEVPGAVIGRFTLVDKLGEGGFGSVWSADQTEPVRRRVALKIIKLGMDTKQVIARFEAERQALAVMDHPGIARVLDAGTTETGRPFFVMELVKGVPITRYCDREKLSTQERLDLFIKVCQAVQHAHQKGIIHRDIKPGNILVTVHDGVPVPKVIDFGIAKATQQDLTELTINTQFGQFIGTPAYMSPEQAEPTGMDIDTRSDLYSLGVLLYELLTGSSPFDWRELMAAGLDAIRRTIREKEPPKPSTKLSQTLATEDLKRAKANDPRTEEIRSSSRRLLQELKGDLDWIVMKCLEKDRERRYESATDLAADLKRHLDNEPVVARPPSAAYKFQKAWRRNRVVFSAGALVAASLVLGVVVSVWQAGVAIDAQHREAAVNDKLVEQIVATDRAKQAETEQRYRAEGALQDMQIQKADALFESGESLLAMKYLGDVLRANPSNEVAASRLVSGVLRPFTALAAEPMSHAGSVNTVEFSPDGSRVVTANSGNYFVAEGEQEGHAARVWDATTGRPLTPPMLHSNQVVAAHFSNDGTRVITASVDRTSRVWDTRTGQPLTGPLQNDDSVTEACFSPDGSKVATASEDGTARIWDALTGQPLTPPLQCGTVVWTVQFSPDGLRILTAASFDSPDQPTAGVAQVWDATTGQPAGNALRVSTPIRFACFSPDGSQIATASDDGRARIWDVNGSHLPRELQGHRAAVTFASYSPDGLRLVTASRDNTARIWDVVTGRPLTGDLIHEGAVSHARFSPDGLRVVTSSGDTTVRMWDAFSGRPLTEPIHHGRPASDAMFSPDGRNIVTASGDGLARIWNIRVAPPINGRLQHRAALRSGHFSSDGQTVLTVSFDRAVTVWDAKNSLSQIAQIRLGAQISHAEFSPDGTRIVTACADRTARVWDARTGEPLTDPLRHKLEVDVASFSADGKKIITTSQDATARIWDAQTGQALTGPLQHGDFEIIWISTAEFNPDGSLAATGCGDNLLRLWDTSTGKLAGDPIRLNGSVNTVRFSPGGSRIVTSSADGTARVWDVKTHQPLTEPLQHEEAVVSAAFSPDGTRIVTASVDGTARLWDAGTGQMLVEPLRHDDEVTSAVFSPDGRRVITASRDSTAKIWDVKSGRLLADPLRHDAAVSSAEFSPDGSIALTTSDDGTARLWEVYPAETPVPDWFLDWAEARINSPLTTRINARAVPFAAQQQRRAEVATITGEGLYYRIARWIESEPADRTITPMGTTTAIEYGARRAAENTLSGLRAALQLTPHDNGPRVRLAALLLQQDINANPSSLEAAMWQAQQVARNEPDNAEAWRVMAVGQRRLGQFEQAIQSVDRTLELDPNQTGSWELKGQLLKRVEQWTQALEAFRKALALQPELPGKPQRARAALLMEQAGLLRELGRTNETAMALAQARVELGIPARDPGTSEHLLDLSSWYNAGLKGSWHRGVENNDLAGLIGNEGSFDGTPFDLRGIVQLAGETNLKEDFPGSTSEVALNLKFRQLHALHATGWSEEAGVTIAVLRVRYADGRQHEFPVRYGEEVLDWFAGAPMVGNMSNGQKVWEGTNGAGISVRLFKSKWENPFPEAEASAIEYVSSETACAPFLVALTVE